MVATSSSRLAVPREANRASVAPWNDPAWHSWPRQAERRRAELLVCRPSEIVCPLVAVHVNVVLAILENFDGLLRTVPLDEPDHEHIVLQQIDVVLRGDILRRLERCVGDGQDQRLRGWSDVFAEGDNQPADFRRKMVVETPEAPGLEGKRPRLAWWDPLLRVEIRENRVGRVDVGRGPERLVGSIDESDLGARLNVEALGDKADACIDDLRSVGVDDLRRIDVADGRHDRGGRRHLWFGARRAGKDGQRYKGKRERI